MVKGLVKEKSLNKQKQIIRAVLIFFACIFVASAITPRFARAQASAGYFLVDLSNVEQRDGSGKAIDNFEDGVTDDDWTYKEQVAGGTNQNSLEAVHNCKSMIAYQDGTPKQGDGQAHLWTNKWVVGENRCRFDFSEAHKDEDMYQIIQAKYKELYGNKLGDPCFSNSGVVPTTCDGWDDLYKIGSQHGDHSVVALKKSSSTDLVNFYLIDDQIWSIDREESFTRSKDDPNIFIKDGQTDCADIITLNPGHAAGDTTVDGKLDREGCKPGGKSDVYLGTVTDDVKRDVANQKAQNDATKNNDHSCEARAVELGWIMCPVVRILDAATDFIDTQIAALLEVDKSSYTNDSDSIHKSWGQIRNIAYFILVPMMLVMLIGTALGWSFVDAYTVKRAMPRMIIAIIFIALSWDICVALIQFSNALGEGVMGIITAPFKETKDVTTLTLSGLFDGNVLIGFFSLPAFAIGLLIILWLFGSALLLFAGIAFLVLLMRQLFIVALMLAAPLAILAWIFPGNDRLWKAWWSLFSKLLLMFPLIMGLIAIGRVFAVIVHSSGIGGIDESEIVSKIVVIVLWLLPYAFIPFTFRFAGGIFANLSGMVQDRSKGISERLKQGRAARVQRTAEGNMFKNAGEGGVKGRLNTYAARTLNANKAGLNPFRMRSSVDSAIGAAAGANIGELLDKNGDIKAVSADDHLAEAVQTATSTAQIEQMLIATGRHGTQGSRALAENVALVKRAQKAGSVASVRGAMAVARANSGTGYASAADMHESILQAAGGNRNLEGQLLAAARSGSERARRPDLAGAGHVEQAEAMNTLRATMGQRNPDGTPTDAHVEARENVNNTMRRASFERQGAYGVMSGRGDAVRAEVEQIGQDYIHARDEGNVELATEYASQIASVRNAMGSASPEARQAATAMLAATGVNLGAPESTDQQLGAQIGGIVGARRSAGNRPELIAQSQAAAAETTTQEIRTRAGLYDSARLTEAERAAQGYRQPEQE